MTKRALVVGINNYTIQSQHDQNLYGLSWPTLQGCVRDADSVYHLFIEAFGFERENVILLKDAQATRRNILSALTYLHANSAAGDVIAFFYAGHGGLLPATTDANNNRFYESIIPYEGDWIYDFQLDAIATAAGFNPHNVNFTLIMDSCHSGGLHTADSIVHGTPRTVPFRPDIAANIKHMQTYWPFGVCLPSGSNELFPNVSNPVIENGQLVDLDIDPNKTLIASAKATLVAACRYDETAGENSSHGYLTQALLDTVDSCPYRITYQSLIERLVARVQTLSGNTQTPQLLGQLGRSGENFLDGWTTSIPD
ncbi:caspase domain-containing protein [Larkinella insperata]|uniref:Caspase domain-containing protein n=1 Tax=Larkinella insperata TaxID=332158 RepID=A0ABW3Q449_9BACT|nr:caspase family protein [Larkinella insperata]